MQLGDSGEPGGDGETLFQSAGGLFAAISELLSDGLRLATLEARLAVLSLAAILALAIGGAVLLVTAWLLLVAAGSMWLMQHGFSWELTLFGGALINGVLGVIMLAMIARFGRNLFFNATRRQLLSWLKQHKDSSDVR